MNVFQQVAWFNLLFMSLHYDQNVVRIYLMWFYLLVSLFAVFN